MSIVTEFTVPAAGFALDHTFETLPSVTVEVERLATHSREWVMPFLWVHGADRSAVEAAFTGDPTIADFTILDADDGRCYVNVHWSEAVQQSVDEIVDMHGIVQEAAADSGEWRLNLQFVDQSALDGFQSYFQEQDAGFELQRLYDGAAPEEREYDLTVDQREAFVTALEMGYYDIPRDARIDDVAAALDISANAVSERLRRATANLGRTTLTVSSSVDRSESG